MRSVVQLDDEMHPTTLISSSTQAALCSLMGKKSILHIFKTYSLLWSSFDRNLFHSADVLHVIDTKTHLFIVFRRRQ